MKEKDGRKMTRRELRDHIFKMLFRIEFHEAQELEEQMQLYREENENLSAKDFEYLTAKCRGVFECVAELDEKINRVSEGWKTSRMGKVDLAIIRLAVYEMQKEEDIPVAVSINEAVELAKKYGTDSSASFVNGVLAKLA